MVGIPEKYRIAIASRYRELGGSYANPDKRIMSEAIFHVESDVEHDACGVWPPKKRELAVARELNRRRNVLLDDIGENELSDARRAAEAKRVSGRSD